MTSIEYENDLKELGFSGQNRLFYRNKFFRYSLVWETLAKFFNPL